jgi:glycosyltransferase involved in cell wall biosynthesis
MIAVAIATADGGRAASLLRCIAAIVDGSLLPTRLLVVDQSGGIEIANALDGLEVPFPLDRIDQAPLGLAASRNLALDRLDEDIVAVTDDDCAPEPGWLAAIAAAFGDSPNLSAVTGPVLPLPPAGDRILAVSTRAAAPRREFGRWSAPWHVGTGGNMAFSRSRLGTLRFDRRLGAGTRGRAGEDLDIVRRLLAAGGQIRFEPAAVVRHERQTVERRRASRFAYGHGVGAMVGVGVREGDVATVVLLARWLVLRGRLALRPGGVGEEARVLAGTLAGLAYGARSR